MSTNIASPEISGPCKRKPSTKASTNGDPQEARKRQKSGTTTKNVVTVLTQKKNVSSKSGSATGTSKAAPVAPNWASAKAPGIQKHATIEHDDSNADLDLDKLASNRTNSEPPQNLNNVLEVAHGSDNGLDESVINLIEDDDKNNTDLEAPEESAEAELGTNLSPYY